MQTINATFPAKLVPPLTTPSRYRVFYGGRGGGKSHSVARFLLIQGLAKPLRVLCVREFMSSVSDSVHKLLQDQILALGFKDRYSVERDRIYSHTGTEFRFAGIRNNVSALKSFEGIDICWVEEAANVTKNSWAVLIPTIRKENSEIIITFNPELETDETYQRFVLKPPPSSIVTKINYDENPWFPQVLKEEAEYMRDNDPDSYQNIYLGFPKVFLDNAVYAKELRQMTEEGRICKVPYDPLVQVQTFWDLGWRDQTSIIIAQTVQNEFRIIDYVTGSQKTINDYLKILQAKPYIYGTDFLPHDANAKNLGSGRSVVEIMRQNGRRVQIVPSLSVQDGINAVRTIFPRVWIDDRCSDLLTSLRKYCYDLTGAKPIPVHNEASHGCLVGDTLVLTEHGYQRIDLIQPGIKVWTPAGYSKVTWAGKVKQTNELIQVSCGNSTLICTPEHKILTNHGFRSADTLRYTDHVLSGNELSCRLISLLSKATNIGFRAIITGEMSGIRAGQATSIAPFGLMPMARFPMTITSIILTAIHSIMNYQIWNVLANMTTYPCTPNSYSQKELFDLQANIAVKRQPSGMDRWRVLHGIQNTERSLGETGFGMNVFAKIRSVVSAICRRILSVANTAPITVRAKQDELELGCQWVYDLTIENHACYQANGILVSNSDAYRYFSISLRAPKEAVKIAQPRYVSTPGGWMS